MGASHGESVGIVNAKNNDRLRILCLAFSTKRVSLGGGSFPKVLVLEKGESASISETPPAPPPPTASAGTTRGLVSTMTFWNVLSLVHSQWQAQPASSGTDFTGRASQAACPRCRGQQVKKTQVGPARLIGQVLHTRSWPTPDLLLPASPHRRKLGPVRAAQQVVASESMKFGKVQ